MSDLSNFSGRGNVAGNVSGSCSNLIHFKLIHFTVSVVDDARKVDNVDHVFGELIRSTAKRYTNSNSFKEFSESNDIVHYPVVETQCSNV